MVEYINVKCETSHLQWHAVGRASDIANSGDYLTVNIGREPLAITRDEEGELRTLSLVYRKNVPTDPGCLADSSCSNS